MTRRALSPAEAERMLSSSWWQMRQPRSILAGKMTRFELEEPRGGDGLTSNMPYLFGYIGDDCVLCTAVLFEELA
jgi:hypothetical protein